MLSKLIVASFGTLLEISLWFFLLLWILLGAWMDGPRGAIVGGIIGFTIEVMFSGGLLALIQIRKSIEKIEVYLIEGPEAAARIAAPKNLAQATENNSVPDEEITELQRQRQCGNCSRFIGDRAVGDFCDCGKRIT